MRDWVESQVATEKQLEDILSREDLRDAVARRISVDGLPGFHLPPPRFEPCPLSERLLGKIVPVPLSPLYGKIEVDQICTAIAAACEEQGA